ncbi:hypothetical protein A3J15_00305 [Candidatus Roizmanbacteria bacterium RIFCSPLOWO2_02_FULL_38_10]|uniref:Uncharacterized protein n=1 Tax=Candidatus Roizmanbacteria bacterium RIFCSPLOWO2_02_FULL_38_10 TaxID=1802074 RepID=A0A1F7JK72_9BACT|nr:MAG: hypothetical protein A3J15_00305 [Candidatus Roizmanbacteria bacterium RIFCSPLOWO2_02_FULL_38_10]
MVDEQRDAGVAGPVNPQDGLRGDEQRAQLTSFISERVMASPFLPEPLDMNGVVQEAIALGLEVRDARSIDGTVTIVNKEPFGVAHRFPGAYIFIDGRLIERELIAAATYDGKPCNWIDRYDRIAGDNGIITAVVERGYFVPLDGGRIPAEETKYLPIPDAKDGGPSFYKASESFHNYVSSPMTPGTPTTYQPPQAT